MQFAIFIISFFKNYFMLKKFTPILCALSLLSLFSSAQDNGYSQDFSSNTKAHKKGYWSTSMEGLIFSSSFTDRPGKNIPFTTVRFTAFFNLGPSYHFDFNKSTGIYTGLTLKNIGYIDKFKNLDSTVKRRLYTLNVPLAFKIGNMNKGNYLFVGAEASLAVNYKEKGFVNRNNKDKFNEWFSERTPLILPNLFIGMHGKYGFYKLSYYPTNFLNPNFVDKNGLKPYANHQVNIFSLTIGVEIPYKPKYD